MFRRLGQTLKNNRGKCLLFITGAQFLTLSYSSFTYGNTSPLLNRKRILLGSTEMELQDSDLIISYLNNKDLGLYHSPQIDEPLNHIVKLGIPKFLNSYEKQVGVEKIESLRKIVEKIRWEGFVFDKVSPNVASVALGKIVVSDSCLKELDEKAVKFVLCREVARSVCRHQNERASSFSIALENLICAVCVAPLYLGRMGVLGVLVAGGSALYLFDAYNRRRMDSEADCVGLVLYGICGWYPSSVPDMEMFLKQYPLTANALKWFKTDPHIGALLLLSKHEDAHQRPDIKDDATQEEDSTKEPDV
ncbi:hypothetical protein ACHQM5_003617 [Ranunculus cassubicifolius]